MLIDFRRWLESARALLADATHHAYSFGQANMAKRAIERLDAEIGDALFVRFSRAEVTAILTELELRPEGDAEVSPALAVLSERLRKTVAASA